MNNAGQAQTERVQTAGNDAVESIKAAQGTATRAVETAKTEAIKAVQTEGTTRPGMSTAEGEKQVQAVQSAAQEIIADREQIQMNKEGVAKLKEDIGNKTSCNNKKSIRKNYYYRGFFKSSSESVIRNRRNYSYREEYFKNRKA